jgi:hypothetical protein
MFKLNIFDLARVFIQFINGILTGSMSRNHQACHTLKELLTTHCHLRHDEIALIMEYIFHHLNHDDDDANNLNHGLNQSTIKVKFIKENKILFRYFVFFLEII